MTSFDSYPVVTFADFVDQQWSFHHRVTFTHDARNHITITPVDGISNHVGPPVELDETQAVALRDWLNTRLAVNNIDNDRPGV